MKTIALIALVAAQSAYANNWPVEPTPAPTTTPAVTQHLGQGQQQVHGQQQGQEANANATNGSLYNMPSSNSRALGVSFSSPSLAAALPGYLCPQGDSLAWSVGWNFFSYAKSSTRTEMECLDKLIAVMNRPQPVEYRLPVTAEIHPHFTPAASIASSTRICTPAKKTVRKKVACK